MNPTMTTLSHHPAADLFPMLGADELQQLADDIKENGLLDSVVLFHGEILDGRNRLAACELAGVEPRFIDVAESVESPVMYVVSKNLHRRHLTTSQRACIGAEMVPLLQVEAKQRQGARTDLVEETTSARERDEVRTRSNAVAARTVGVGETSISRAMVAKRDNPEGFDKAKRGEMTVYAAADGHTEQPKVGGNNGVGDLKSELGKTRAFAQKRKMEVALSTITGCCRGFQELDLKLVMSACDQEEIATWVERTKELAKQIRNFSAQLERTK